MQPALHPVVAADFRSDRSNLGPVGDSDHAAVPVEQDGDVCAKADNIDRSHILPLEQLASVSVGRHGRGLAQ